ncbi:MAG: threonylcarbamoyl-AMP synthase [Candidatus Omnitrophica bacterium]|nr:threonylcarbamoyl-AMP synthase [Candidatus Omnitrophota bacterium]
MKTKVVKIDVQHIDLEKIKKAAAIIKKGGIVAFPTETVYGLAADYLNKKAVDRVFRLKKRPKDKPLPVQIQDITYLEKLACDIPVFAYQLMSKFWPGPLTLVLKAEALQRRRTIGVRISDNKIAQSLIKMSRTPLVVPSANLSGEPAGQTAEEVLHTFEGLIEMVIDGGKVELGIASTVVDLSVSPYKILREGVISKKDIQSAQG